MTLEHLGAWTGEGDQPDYLSLNRVDDQINLVAREACGGGVTKTAVLSIPPAAFLELVMAFLRDFMAEQLGCDPKEAELKVVLVQPGYRLACVKAEESPQEHS